MSIVTKGLGGRSLITKGYGIWEWIIEKVVEIVRAVTPIDTFGLHEWLVIVN